MDKFETDLKAALATAPEPADAGFSDAVMTRVAQSDRTRTVLLGALMAGAALLFVMLARGLQALSPLWTELARQNWFALSPDLSHAFSLGAPIAALVLFSALAATLARAAD